MGGIKSGEKTSVLVVGATAARDWSRHRESPTPFFIQETRRSSCRSFFL
ncbi:BnaC05g29000D [Brassica napus]|uniref:(rape) hypothetical protein n=1 Tax=Brassica napus TaxID=3708 RepID=A0A078GWM3_BRANA|nr:unnamed protein product [Brassica napus]CDY29936.1 BnaC05g29000D [Brassica napus]